MKPKKPIYKRVWFWVLVVLFLSAIGNAMGGGTNTSTTSRQPSRAPTQQTQPAAPAQEQAPAPAQTPTPAPVIEYTSVDLQTMLDELDSNALRAEQTYNKAYVELVGKISVIDSDGKYISIEPVDADSWNLDSVHCSLKTDEHRAVIMNKGRGETVTVRGQITEVGEIMGYTLKVDTIS